MWQTRRSRTALQLLLGCQHRSLPSADLTITMFAPQVLEYVRMNRIEVLPLPRCRHHPGEGTVPDDRLISAVLSQVLPETREEQAHYNLVWLYGLRLFNCGYFWEACEVLEPVWERAEQNSRERFLLQAVIHLADAALQCELGNDRQCARQCDLARLCIEHCFADNQSRLMGLFDRDVIFAIEQVEGGSTEIWLQHAL